MYLVYAAFSNRKRKTEAQAIFLHPFIDDEIFVNIGKVYKLVITINAPVFFMERGFARAISGPKKVSNSGPTPITGPRNAYFPPEIHYFPLHKKHRCINSYFKRLQVSLLEKQRNRHNEI
jgi:hypothetical protein